MRVRSKISASDRSPQQADVGELQVWKLAMMASAPVASGSAHLGKG